MKKGFTLIELLIVLALISILAGILIVVIKPQEIFRRARDAQRKGDLSNVQRAIDAYLADVMQNPNISVNWCTTSTISYSYPFTSAPAGWPPTTGYTATGTTSTAVNGTGWVRYVTLASSTLVNLSSLPLDPLNSTVGGTGYFYAFVCTGNAGEYELDAKLEGDTSSMQNDGGNQDGLYEVGPNKNLY
ncbi:MAG: type II secretion system protein [Candidatus Pacebacteria bacterium]|jgi:prepilin-type N-terminal cleavage/methylation domain-containing protein|nr:type II secretion system protein [Candidatus Paceibacterota bacterium]